MLSAVFVKILHPELFGDPTDYPHLNLGDDRNFVKIKNSYATANRAKKVK